MFLIFACRFFLQIGQNKFYQFIIANRDWVKKCFFSRVIAQRSIAIDLFKLIFWPWCCFITFVWANYLEDFKRLIFPLKVAAVCINYANPQLEVYMQFALLLYYCNLRQVCMIAICVRFIWLQFASGLYDCSLLQVYMIANCVRFVLLQFVSGLYYYNLRQGYIITNCVRFIWLQIA